VRSSEATTPTAATVDMRLEVVVIPVSDADRAKRFYANLGWRLDADKTSGESFRLIQFTPKGSGCSIQFGTNLTPAEPGSAQALHLIVSDIEAARDELVAHGVDVSEVFHCATGYACRFPGQGERLSGRHPDRGTYGSFLSFSDPDGNGWLLQEVSARFPGRLDGDTTYASAGDLSGALKRAAAAYAEREAGSGQADPDWADWYAEYLVREQSGEGLPS
jgi:catechol 2,3-dioxygenase-like lactoylglutathione lyase family enzyme